MESIYFVMAILGCGDGQVDCQQARIEPVRYRTAAQCQAAMAGALQRNSDLMYPVVAAACQQRGQQMARAELPFRG